MSIQNKDSITIHNILDTINITNVNNRMDEHRMDEHRMDEHRMDEHRMDEHRMDEVDEKEFPLQIYRYKFTEEFIEVLYNFSKIHQYDDRKDFKEAWKVWSEDNEEIIDIEMRRLLNLGYEGDVLTKMFKSARYYFRKKSSEKKEPKQRRPYISVNRELLNAMDHHIEEKIHKPDYQPKTGFIDFCKENEVILKETITKIFEQGIKDSNLIEDKIKKTYKNRYFMLINKK
jgi:hypothetical protein